MALGIPPAQCQPIQDSRQDIAANGAFRHDRHAFMRGVINYGQAFDHAGIGCSIKHEVH